MPSANRILVVDDDATILAMTRRALEPAGYTVFTEQDGEMALERVRQYQPAVVLLDVNMPNVNGFEVCRRIKSDPNLASVFVVILSASRIDLESKVTGLGIGADDYLTRPIPNPELLARLDAILRIRAAEAAVRDRERQLHDLIAGNVDGMLVIDESGRVLFANPAACALLDRQPEHIVGQEVGLPLAPAGQATELEVLRPDGGKRIVELRATALDWQAQPAWLAALRDITERKLAEDRLHAALAELRRSNADLESFAHVVSHDLQEPLRMVTGFLGLLNARYQGQLDADADEFIGFALDGARRMQRLIQDLLAYARVDSRGGALTPTDTESVLVQALDNLQAALQESHAVVTHDPLPVVLGDETQLVQLFQNLIGNAIKFRGAEPSRVHVAAHLQSAGLEPLLPYVQSERPDLHSEWVFSVHDNGIGIEPQYFERIFVIFQRLHARHEYPGTGIGLAVCKKIVERHGGRIWVESTPGQGSTFYFTLPATV